MSDPRANKRWRRENRKKNATRKSTPAGAQLVYRPKSSAEAQRRTMRAAAFVGKPFLRLDALAVRLAAIAPNIASGWVISSDGVFRPGTVMFTARDGTQITVEMVEMVYNDMLLMDAISDQGVDGPLYKDTVEGTQLEILDFAVEAYAGRKWE